MDHWKVLLLALVIDVAVGDPPWLYRKIPHPVALLGQWIAAGEHRLNRGPERWRWFGGALLTLLVAGLAASLGWSIHAILAWLPLGWIAEALLASALFAWRGLYEHVSAVARALRCSLEAAREAVSHIVGRDPQRLDKAGIARAAVESSAENFSDAVVAPAFWFVLLGLPGLCAYKAINTLDSMIGHRSERYRAFGKAAARLDDAVNWLPARLSGLLFVAAAALLPRADAKRAWTTMRRDAPKHRSPNAGWPEAALAGALGFALAGPRHYADTRVEDRWMGDGRAALDAADIRRALHLYCTAGALLLALAAALALL